jgi:hypothetical protein
VVFERKHRGWQQDLQVASAAEYSAKDFWSIVLYDNQTRSMLQTDQRLPTVGSQKGAVANPDTSVDVYFGPPALAGHEANWVQTIPGKGWNVLFASTARSSRGMTRGGGQVRSS